MSTQKMQSKERGRQRKHTHDRLLVLSKLRHRLGQFLLCCFRGKAGHKYNSVLATLPCLGVRGSRSAIATVLPRSIHTRARIFFTTALRAFVVRMLSRHIDLPPGPVAGPLAMCMQRVLDTVDVRAPSARCTKMRLTSPKRCRAVDSRAKWWLLGSVSLACSCEDDGGSKMGE
jgi:hypothetical protein